MRNQRISKNCGQSRPEYAIRKTGKTKGVINSQPSTPCDVQTAIINMDAMYLPQNDQIRAQIT